MESLVREANKIIVNIKMGFKINVDSIFVECEIPDLQDLLQDQVIYLK